MTTELNDYPRKYVQINGKGPIYCLHGTSSINAFEALEKELAELQSRQDHVREVVSLREKNSDLMNALKAIKTRVCGEALPYWENTERTGVSRGWIADVCDDAMRERNGTS